jgi:hypothetical protein
MTLLSDIAFAEMEASRLVKFERGDIPFKDTDDHEWYFPFVDEIASVGIISGYVGADGTLLGEYRPGNTLTVAEGLKIVLESAEKGINEASNAPNVRASIGHWAQKYFVKADELGMTLVSDAGLDPNRSITRFEVVRLILEARGIQPAIVNESSFNDVSAKTIESSFIEYATQVGIIQGYDDGTFRSTNSINRAEMAKVIVQAMEVL